MPHSGKQNVQSAAQRAPLLTGFDTEVWELPGAEILHLLFVMEIQWSDVHIKSKSEYHSDLLHYMDFARSAIWVRSVCVSWSIVKMAPR